MRMSMTYPWRFREYMQQAAAGDDEILTLT